MINIFAVNGTQNPQDSVLFSHVHGRRGTDIGDACSFRLSIPEAIRHTAAAHANSVQRN